MSDLDKFMKSFSNSLGISPSVVTDDLEYQSIPEWDSVGHMAMISEIEECFDIMLDTDDIIDLSSVKIAKKILKKYGVKI